MDLNKLTQSEKIIAGSGIGLLIFSFFPWFGLAGGSNSGWDYFLWGVIPTLLGLAIVAQIALTKFTETKLPEKLGNFTWAQVHLIAGCVAAALIIVKLAMGDSVGAFGVDIDLDRKFGIFLSAIAAIGLAAGSFMEMKEGQSGGTAPPA